jgi:cytoskeleton protein RodZ
MEKPEPQMQLDEMGTIGPGRYLLKARENKKLRIEDVAFELRLVPSQVVALEEDDYSSMPEVTYVRGYLRNYARLLGLSPDEILLAHARITRSDDLGKVAVAPVGEKEIHTAGIGVKLLGLFIILAMIAGAVYWSLDSDVDQPEPVAAIPEPEAPVIEEVPTGTSKLSFAEPAPEPEPETVAAASTEPVEALIENNTEEVVTPEQAPEASAPIEAPAEQPAPVAEAPAQTVASVEQSPVTDGTGKLVISYQKSCWTDIRDVNGKKLVYKTIAAGETINVEGQTPFTLFFGFAVGVDLTFNGTPVDLKEHTRGVFARLTLGE